MPKPWTEDEKIYLEYYIFSDDTSDFNEASYYLDRSKGSLRKQAFLIRKDNKDLRFRKEWTEEDLNFLKQNYLIKTDKEIAFKLQRTKNAVERKRLLLGLKKRSTKEERQSAVRSLIKKGLTRKEIASELGKQYCLICQDVKEISPFYEKQEPGSYFRKTNMVKRGGTK